MKKQLIVCLLGLLYMVFCSAGLSISLADPQQQTVHFMHLDGNADEYHATIPGKLAIKAFFAKAPSKSTCIAIQPVPGNLRLNRMVKEHHASILHTSSHSLATVDLTVLHCSFLL
jgi:hypothetical protein